MTAATATNFSSVDMRALSDALYLLGVSLLAHFISRRVRLVDISSLHGLRQVSFPRLLTVVTFCDSWAFLFASSILSHGLGLELRQAVCTAGLGICIGFYVTSKLFLFLFFTEKVHIVWSSMKGTPRRKSPVYIFCMIMVLAYSSIGLHLIWERIAYFRESDGRCVIGLKLSGSLLVLSYDAFINVMLLLMFLYPLIRAHVRNLYLRSIALRAVYATLLMCTSTTINVVILTAMDGSEVAWVCLASCGADIIANATVLFWATSGSSLRPEGETRVKGAVVDGLFTPKGAFVGGTTHSSSDAPSFASSTTCGSSIHSSSAGDVDPYSIRLDCMSVFPVNASRPISDSLSVIMEVDENEKQSDIDEASLTASEFDNGEKSEVGSVVEICYRVSDSDPDVSEV